MKFFTSIGMAIALSILLGYTLGSCGDDDSNNNIIRDGGTDADADADTDADADSDTDTDADTDTSGTPEYDTAVVTGTNKMVPNIEGWIEPEGNGLGVRGAWYTFGCTGAVFTPAADTTFTNTGKMCFSGTAPMVIDGVDEDTELDWSDMWGAGMAFDICGDAENPDAPKGTLGNCTDPATSAPLNLATTVKGVEVKFSGTVNAAELRIQFNEGEGITAFYAIVTPQQVADGNVVKATFTGPETSIHWSQNPARERPEGIQVQNIQAIQFQVPTNQNADVNWDFCVEDIALIVE